MRMSQYRAHQVSLIIQSRGYRKLTDPSQWNQIILASVVAEFVGKDADVYLSTGHFGELPDPNNSRVAHDYEALLTNPMSDALGNLRRLPREILWMIIEYLDLQSCLRFSQTCRMLRDFCQENTCYKVVHRYISWFLLILKSLGLQYWITVRGLCEEVQQPKCRSCGSNGHLLFLPTCERICTNCLWYNPAYWCIPLSEAQIAFDLANNDFLHLPIFRDRRHKFVTGGPHFALNNPGFLVPIKSALQFSIEAHGSRDNMKAAAEQDAVDNKTFNRTTSEEVRGFLHRFWRDTVLEKLPCDPTQVATVSKDLVKAQSLFDLDICKASSLVFYLPKEGHGQYLVPFYRCKGCSYVLDHFDIMPDHRAYMGDGDQNVTPDAYERILRGRARMVHTWEELRAHIPKCLGCGIMMWRHRVHSLVPPPTDLNI